MPTTKYLFASYARPDREAVMPIVQALSQELEFRGLDIHVWLDVDDLRPGQQWTLEITRVLQDCIGLLAFVSHHAIESVWVRKELQVAFERTDRLIIPIILEQVREVPHELALRQWVDLSAVGSRSPGSVALLKAVQQIAEVIQDYLRTDRITPLVSATEAPAVAASIAEETRGVQQKSTARAAAPNSVFIVHGHDGPTLNLVNAYLTSLGIKTVVLSKIAGPAQSLFQKFLKSSAEARFAIVILTSDDFGVSRVQYEAAGVGKRALQFRARQNVILELGFFYGQLGWENVFVVYRSPDKVFPNFERPSDLDGILFVEIDETGQWRDVLRDNLLKAGFQL